MPKIAISGRLAVYLPALALACAGLSACGSSSGAAHTGTTSAAHAATAPPQSTQPTMPQTAVSKPLRPGSTPLAHSMHRPVMPVTPQATAFRSALAQFADCLRSNGVKIPAPNASGSGPVLSAKGLNTNTPQYRAALTKCRTVLVGAFRRASNAAKNKR